MKKVKSEIEEIVNRETKAWDTQDAELLMSIFHPDMVWPFPRTDHSHDPMDWIMVPGRYDFNRWLNGWQELFDTHRLIHNKREIKKIVVSNEGDGAFAVGDIDTLWQDRKGNNDQWKGRVCKVYTKGRELIKLIKYTELTFIKTIPEKI